VGDIDYVDADQFLYITDRKAFMIISGGVNIYPKRWRTFSRYTQRSPTSQ